MKPATCAWVWLLVQSIGAAWGVDRALPLECHSLGGCLGADCGVVEKVHIKVHAISNSNLLQRCAAITTAMQARGFVGAAQHTVYVQDQRQGSWALDALALGTLVVTAVLVKRL